MTPDTNITKEQKTHNYKCSKCGSTYTGLKKPLSYDTYIAVTSFSPNKVCTGRLKSTDNPY